MVDRPMSKPITPLRGLTPTLFSCVAGCRRDGGPDAASMPCHTDAPKRVPRRAVQVTGHGLRAGGRWDRVPDKVYMVLGVVASCSHAMAAWPSRLWT